MNKPGIKYISLDDIKLTVFSFVTENLKFDQPLPSFQTADKNKLSSITASLQQTVGGEDAYEGLVKKSTILLYRMIKDHPFLNGNKRMVEASLAKDGLEIVYMKNNRPLEEEDVQRIEAIFVNIAKTFVIVE